LTEKLYYHNPYLKTFTARVVRYLHHDGHPAVVLDQTAFYPTGGGQPNDTGTLNGVVVFDVQPGDERQVIHLLRAPLTQDQVIGEIDWARRFDHMQQHSGQHILSQAFEQTLNAQTVGFHLGEAVCTIDLDRAPLSTEQVAPALRQANQIVLENRPIIARFVEPEELAPMPLRKMPTVDGPIRIVQVQDYDWSPCGGTHVARSGEIGPIQIVRLERRKAQTRVHFLCGWRALADYNAKQQIVQSLSTRFTTAEDDIVPTIERMETEIKALRKQIDTVQAQLVEYRLVGWLDSAMPTGPWRVIALTLDEYDLAMVKEIARRLTERPGVIALLTSHTNLVFACAQDVNADMNAAIQAACAVGGGKGGGRPQFAQGSLAERSLIQTALAAAREILNPPA